MRRIRIFVVGLLMLWLPLQAIAAVSMPFCAHSATGSPALAPSKAHHHHGEVRPASDPHAGHGDQHTAAADLQPCNNCGACNLASAPAVLVAAVVISASFGDVQPQFSRQFPELFISEQPQPSPNSRL
jgi:hypothetical protein